LTGYSVVAHVGNNVNISSAVAIQQTSGPRFDLSDATFDRFISNDVLDLLSEEDTNALLSEANNNQRKDCAGKC
jgi:hypothetical protein